MALIKNLAERILSDELQTLDENIRVEMKQRDDTIQEFTERLWELEQELYREGWERLTDQNNREFSRDGLQRINELAREFWFKNPLIKRAVLTQAQYVWGQGVNIEAGDEQVNDFLKTFFTNEGNEPIIGDQQARMMLETELQLFGNLYFVFFVKNGRTSVRLLPNDEISDIITDPQDRNKVLYYERKFTQTKKDGSPEAKTIYYPDWNHRNPPAIYNKIPVDKAVVYHVSVNKLHDMKYGVSEVYAAFGWARAYKSFLEDWATITKSHATFAWKVKTKGGKRGVSAIKKKMQSTVSTNQEENNPSPAVGSANVSTEGVDWQPMKIAGANIKAEDGDKMIHMVSAATGIFYHYLVGDPSTGNLATAKSMERPMEIMFTNRQQLWVSVLKKISKFVIKQAIKGGVLPGKIIQDDFGYDTVQLNVKDDSINIEFPELLEKDTAARVDAIVKAQTMGGVPGVTVFDRKYVARLLMQALGETEIDEWLEQMYPDDTRNSEAKFKTAMDELREAIKELTNGKS